MKVRIQPSPCGGTVKIPPSKSMAHRAVICAALAQGTSVIENIAYSEDVKTTLLGMEQLGATVERGEHSVTITGLASLQNCGDMVVDCNESGSTLRFFIPIFSLTGAPVSYTHLNGQPEQELETILYRALMVKKTVVEQDEKEANLRKILNFGHTIGHGIESVYGLGGLLHGECVALGMLPMIEDDALRARTKAVLEKLDVPTQVEYCLLYTSRCV